MCIYQIEHLRFGFDSVITLFVQQLHHYFWPAFLLWMLLIGIVVACYFVRDKAKADNLRYLCYPLFQIQFWVWILGLIFGDNLWGSDLWSRSSANLFGMHPWIFGRGGYMFCFTSGPSSMQVFLSEAFTMALSLVVEMAGLCIAAFLLHLRFKSTPRIPAINVVGVISAILSIIFIQCGSLYIMLYAFRS